MVPTKVYKLREFTAQKIMDLYYVELENQVAYSLTKFLSESAMVKHRNTMLGCLGPPTTLKERRNQRAYGGCLSGGERLWRTSQAAHSTGLLLTVRLVKSDVKPFGSLKRASRTVD